MKMTLLGLSCGLRGKKFKKTIGKCLWNLHDKPRPSCTICVAKWNFYHSLLNNPIPVRFFSSEPKKKSYYDTLGITPKATHAQVKNAYYDLSKQFHPDQYKGRDGSDKFREISEAYEVLGNFQKRRMYDKGIFNIGTAATPQEAEAYSSKFYESRRTRGKMPSAGRTPIYNFDEWSKTHYESNVDRKKQAKMAYEYIQRSQKEAKEEKKAHSVMYLVLLLVWMLIYGNSISTKMDEPQLSEAKQKKEK